MQVEVGVAARLPILDNILISFDRAANALDGRPVGTARRPGGARTQAKPLLGCHSAFLHLQQFQKLPETVFLVADQVPGFR